MLLLLPPSETKRDGGDVARRLAVAELGFAALLRPRRTAIAALRTLARNREAMSVSLGLGPQLAFEVDRNRTLGSSPTLPALERYTGILYDALDVPTLPAAALAMADETVVIHSALFGLLLAGDHIPAYRLSHDSKLPDVRLRGLWAQPIARELDAVEGLVIDMRSEGYVTLGPLSPSPNRAFLRVVTEASGGTRRALTHFNKRAKGAFVRAVLTSGIRHPDLASLMEWAARAGTRLEQDAPGEVQLIVDESRATLRA